MDRLIFYLMAVITVIVLFGCSISVPASKVNGTYKASYQFGSETISLNPNGSFVQEIAIKNEAPVTVSGKWEYDANGGRVNLEGFVSAVDGFGHLRSDWRAVKPGVASFDIEIHWFRIVMASAAAHPYVKQK